MASIMRCLVTLAALTPLVLALDVTPIGKVVKLLEDLRTEANSDAQKEATVYALFADGCKTHTQTKSSAITLESETIGLESANLGSKFTTRDNTANTLSENKAEHEQLSADLQQETTRCRKQKDDYEDADHKLSSSIAGLKNAFDSITASIPATSLIQGSGASFKLPQELKDTLDMAEAMGMVVLPKHKDAAFFMQGKAKAQGQGAGDDVKDREYTFRSDDINALFKSLHTQFTEQKAAADAKQVLAVAGCTSMKTSLGDSITLAGDAIAANKREISRLEDEIGDHRKNLVNEHTDLTENELYLKDLTAECEVRAKDWDQRSQMAIDEVAAISTALSVLTGEDGVKQAADAVNQRAMLITATKPKVALAKAVSHQVLDEAPTRKALKRVAALKKLASVDDDDDDDESLPNAFQKHVSLVQIVKVKTSFLASQSTTEAKRKEKALAFLSTEGQRLQSLTLLNLAQSTGADPFSKVKGLVDKLIQRLIQEATNEATKQGFCNTEVGKAEKERDYRFADSRDLNADVAGLQAKQDALELSISLLTTDATETRTAVGTGAELRKAEKQTNADTLAKANEGVAALHSATATLRAFYNNAAKASFVQLSPIIEGGIDAGFSGSARGHQSGSHAILGLLTTISADFDRTIRTTQASETRSARDWVTASQNFKAHISATEMKLALSEQDLHTAQTSLGTKFGELTTAQELLDGALQTLETLKPTCMDSGMSFEERTAKRQQEVTALQSALTMLGGAAE